jgi:hypothetical protein
MTVERDHLWAEYVKLFGDKAGLEMTAAYLFARDKGSHGFGRGSLRHNPYRPDALNLDTAEPLDIDKTSSPHG